MKTLGGLALAVALVFMFAGEQAGPGNSGAPQGVQVTGARHRVDFEKPEVIEGTRDVPELPIIVVPAEIKHPNLIKYRDNFNDRVLQSVNAL